MKPVHAMAAKQLMKLVTKCFVQLPGSFGGSAIQLPKMTNKQDKMCLLLDTWWYPPRGTFQHNYL